MTCLPVQYTTVFCPNCFLTLYSFIFSSNSFFPFAEGFEKNKKKMKRKKIIPYIFLKEENNWSLFIWGLGLGLLKKPN